jgi:transposase
MSGVRHFTATSPACRVGRAERFPYALSLASNWGLTPGCRISGENSQRLGSITKAGSGMARWLLGQVTHKVQRRHRPVVWSAAVTPAFGQWRSTRIIACKTLVEWHRPPRSPAEIVRIARLLQPPKGG